MHCDGAARPLGCSGFGTGAARHAPRIAPPLLVQPERTPSVSVRPLAAERRGSEAWRIRQRQGGRVSPIHDDDSTRRPIIIAVVVARWRGGAVAHHARLAARLERRVLPIHLAILGALAAKLLEVAASETTAAVRRRGAEREKTNGFDSARHTGGSEVTHRQARCCRMISR